MRVLHVSVPRSLFSLWGVDGMLERIQRCEIKEIYHYDGQHIFSKQVIFFKPGVVERHQDIFGYLKDHYNATHFHLLGRNDNEITCILNQKRDTDIGTLQEYAWAIIPPVSITEDSLVASILVVDEDVRTFIEKALETGELSVLSNTRVEDFKSGFGCLGFSMPHITNRQVETTLLLFISAPVTERNSMEKNWKKERNTSFTS